MKTFPFKLPVAVLFRTSLGLPPLRSLPWGRLPIVGAGLRRGLGPPAGGPFTVPPLPYAFDALEPHIDAQTMQIHHDKHHAAYVTNLNKALADAPELGRKPIEELLSNLNAAAGESAHGRA